MPAPFILYHNPRCSKSRSAFDLLQERGIEAEVVRYLDTPPDLAALQDIFRKLGLESARGPLLFQCAIPPHGPRRTSHHPGAALRRGPPRPDSRPIRAHRLGGPLGS